jgi:hypothetical protein
MYRAFNINGIHWDSLSSTSAKALYEENSSEILKSLDSFIKNGIINGTQLTNHWFPKIKADVFISHSHSDKSSAIKFASWLKDRFDLNAFVDSCIWGHAEDLLRNIDNEFCLNPTRETYDYEKRNQSTSHVHMMLATALSEMIDTAECVFFLNTPNSITSEEAVTKTKSPWLSYELSAMRIIRRRKPQRILIEYNFSGEISKAASLKIEYEAPLDELTLIEWKDLNDWREACSAHSLKTKRALDVLYKLHPGPK